MSALPRQEALIDVPPGQAGAQSAGGASASATGDAGETGHLPPALSTAPEVAAKRKAAARESDGVVAIYLEVMGAKYKYQGAKDAEGWKRMRAVASVAEIEQRWRVGLLAKGWLHVDTLAQLDAKWNELAPLTPKPGGVQHLPCVVCEEPAPHWYAKLWFCTPHLDGAMRAREQSPEIQPRPSVPGDVRVREWQQAADLAVFQWAQSARQERR